MDAFPMLILCGGKKFNKNLKEIENLRLHCPRCQNNSVMAIKKREFFTLCFVPVLPTSYGEYLQCDKCLWNHKSTRQQILSLKNQSTQSQVEQMIAMASQPVPSTPEQGAVYYPSNYHPNNR
ncbi:hypothetical protein V1514DRAFT_323251 [Lipomyces japonicus]|uniref:uncharacterized protein n=1 Tax=Lipomyces japonicus TaxID=56871 RepID=UPI0034CDFC70